MGRSGWHQLLIFSSFDRRETAGFPPAFLFERRYRFAFDHARAMQKIIPALHGTFTVMRYYARAGSGGQTNMRNVALGLIFSAVSVPCLAQTVLKSEPLILAPYEIVLVQDASCPDGKVLKVTGAIRGLHRRKVCVSLASEQASLVTATP
jgi:hypothetical protein